MNFSRAKKSERSAMAEFIRNASSEKKNKVYRSVLVKATESQKEVVMRAASSGRLVRAR